VVETVDRVPARGGGELALRRDGDHYEIISNGTFLMDTRDGRSERLLVAAALARCPAPGPQVLIGGLGVGFSLAEAVRDARPATITVVEIEPAVIAWQRSHLTSYSHHALADSRVRVVCADLLPWLAGTAEDFDVICLDIDNGPHWTVQDGNRPLYGEAGLDLLRRRLAGGGVLAVWSAARVDGFEILLRRLFSTVDVHEVPVPRGEPDVVYVASSVTAGGSHRPAR
jgi:spermidine synthase